MLTCSSCCVTVTFQIWKATPTRAFNELLYEFLRIFLISENSLKFANFFAEVTNSRSMWVTYKGNLKQIILDNVNSHSGVAEEQELYLSGTIHLYLHKAIMPWYGAISPPWALSPGWGFASGRLRLCQRRFKDWKANFIALASSSRRCPRGWSEKHYSFIQGRTQDRADGAKAPPPRNPPKKIIYSFKSGAFYVSQFVYTVAEYVPPIQLINWHNHLPNSRCWQVLFTQQTLSVVTTRFIVLRFCQLH